MREEWEHEYDLNTRIHMQEMSQRNPFFYTNYKKLTTTTKIISTL